MRSDKAPVPNPFGVEVEREGERYFIPANRLPKLIYLLLACVILGLGCWLNGEILIRLAFGETTEARVSEIRVDAPGKPERSYKYRRPWKDEGEYRKIFSHYVDVIIDGQPVPYRISVDSRRIPIEFLNVNDRVDVTFFPDDERRVAFAYKQVRTWGMAILFMALGGTMLATALPMYLAVGKPLRIDPEAEE